MSRSPTLPALTTGAPTTTTVPSGNAATKWTVKSVGARTDRTFPIGDTGTTKVDASFGDMVNVVVQLKDSSDADTTVGTDGSGPASFEVHYILVSNYLTQLTRASNQSGLFWSNPTGSVTINFRTTFATNRNGSLTYPAWHADPEPSASGNKASLGLTIRAKANAPGATDSGATTRLAHAIVRYYEP